MKGRERNNGEKITGTMNEQVEIRVKKKKARVEKKATRSKKIHAEEKNLHSKEKYADR